jgi:HlyD family secretion protein
MADPSFRDTSAQDRPMLARTGGLMGGKMARWALAALVLAVLGLLLMLALPWLRADSSLRASALRFAVVTQGDFVADVSGYANVVAARAPTLYAELAGTVVYQVEAGQSVLEGAILAEVQNPELANRVRQEQSNQASLESEAERQRINNARMVLERERARDEAQIAATAAQRELERSTRAFERQAISEVEFRRSEDAIAAAKLRLNAATRDLALEREALSLELSNRRMQVERQKLVVSELNRQQLGLQLRAPFAGVVGSRLVADRASVPANTGVLTVVDLRAFELDLSVSELYAQRLAAGQLANVEREGLAFTAEVKGISPEVVGGQVGVRLRFSGGEPAGLKQNQRVLVRVELARIANALTLERGAYLDGLAGKAVWLRSAGKLTKHTIEVGEIGADRVQILSGLKVGDSVCLSAVDVPVAVREVYLHE